MKRLMRHTRGVGFALLLLGLFALVAAVAVPTTASAGEDNGRDAVAVLMDQPTNPGNSENAPGQIAKEDGTKPGGNNGVLKVDGKPVDTPGPGGNDKPGQGHRDNEPHVGCIFNLDWYGYESGAGATSVKFELWGPNKGYSLGTYANPAVNVGGDAQGNATDQDATQQYDLSGALAAAEAAGASPNEQQGWLLKVTVHTDGLSQGADVKHKVFWVDECGPNDTPTTVTRQIVELYLGEPITTTTTEAPTTTVEVAPTVIAAAPTTTEPAQVLGISLARTGAMTTTLLLLGGVALAMGGALLFATKEPEQA